MSSSPPHPVPARVPGLVLLLVLMLAAGPATAQPAPVPAAPATPPPAAPALPWPLKAAVKGCREVRFGQTTTFAFPGVVATGVSRALTGNTRETGFGGEVGMGFCLTDLVEVGGVTGVNLLHYDDRTALTAPFVGFLKLNFGRRESRLNPFAELGLGALVFAYDDDVLGLLTFQARAGLEVFVRGAWGFFVSPGVQLISDARRDHFLTFRLGWGLSAYF